MPGATLEPAETAAIKRDERGRILPGSVLNPKGNTRSIEKAMREACPAEELAGFLASVVRGVMPAGATRATSDAPTMRERLAAAKLLMDRGWGRVPQTINVAAQVDGGADMGTIRVDDLDEAAAEVLERALASRLLRDGDLDDAELVDDEPIEVGRR